MLSQRITLYLVMAANGRQQAVSVAEDALNLFSQTHHKLLEGDGASLPGLFSPALRDVFDGPTQGRRRIEAFLGLARETVSSVKQGVALLPVVVDGLVDGATAVLSLLNLVTQTYEDEALSIVRRERDAQLQLDATLLAVAAVLQNNPEAMQLKRLAMQLHEIVHARQSRLDPF